MSCKSISRVFSAARPRQSHDPIAFLYACRTRAATSTTLRPSNTQPRHASLMSRPEIAQGRCFSTSRLHSATIVKQNPRADEDGNEMSIDISERAAKRLRQIVSTPPRKNSLTSTPSTAPDSHLRVTVTAGGCHGFQYLMSLEPADKIDHEEDTIFEFEDEGQGRKAEVVLDQPSLELLKGSTIDFTTELIGSQFKIVGNPRATSSCGCGTSFDIE